MFGPVIYSIRNVATGHVYIGSAVDFVRRVTKHKNDLRKQMHHSEHLQRSYQKYGAESFEFSVIEYVDSRDRLLEREQTWIDFFKPAYNVAKVVAFPMLGRKHTPETLAKMSATRKGRKRPPMSEEWKAKISATKTGRTFSPEGFASFREKRRLLFANPEFAEKWRAIRRGRFVSSATRAKLSAAGIGNKRALGFKHAPEVYDSRRGRRMS